MRGRAVLLGVLVVLLILPLTVPAGALSDEEILTAQEEALELDRLEQAAKSSGGTARYGETLEHGLDRLLDQGRQGAGGALRGAVRSGVLLTVILLLCGLSENLHAGSGGDRLQAVTLAGALAIGLVAAGDINTMLGLGRTAIERISSFSTVLLPVVTAVTAATGAITGGAVRQTAAVMFSGLLVRLIESVLIPLLYGYLAVSVAQAALNSDGLGRIAALLKWAATTLLTAVMLAFVGYLSVSGVIAGTADAAAVKAAKFAISGAIPVVGGILSDAADTVLASAGILKGTVGVFGMMTVLSICLLPLLRLTVHYLVYKLVSAVSGAIAPPGISALVDRLGSAFALMMGMTGASCLLLLVALVSAVTAVSV